MNKKLARALQKMIKVDQDAIRKRQKTGVLDLRIFEKHTLKMKKVVAQYGWPTVSLVGKAGSKNAWLIVQHAEHAVRFQKECLRLMQDAVKKNKREVNSMHIAFLIDRIHVNKKKPQTFGTQFYTNKKGTFTYWPIENIRHVDARRKAYGIEPLAVYVKAAKVYKLPRIKKILR